MVSFRLLLPLFPILRVARSRKHYLTTEVDCCYCGLDSPGRGVTAGTAGSWKTAEVSPLSECLRLSLSPVFFNLFNETAWPNKACTAYAIGKMFKFEQSRHDCQPYRYHTRFGRVSPGSCCSRERKGRVANRVVRTGSLEAYAELPEARRPHRPSSSRCRYRFTRAKAVHNHA